ncbi:MAG TPA: DUF4389 domain-containing protein [Bacteroidota bacterium]|jgi:hypothetical protein|nr:DUF4389 domain-containing protein [Bacteroidota bacterium]
MSYPVKFNVEYPEKSSRGILLLRTFFGWLYVGIPHGFMLAIFGIGVFFVMIIAWFAILFTGKFPKGMFDFIIRYLRWQANVNAYMMFLTDKYPPFTGKEVEEQKVN